MTHEARVLFYSRKHWEKMLQQQNDYIAELKRSPKMCIGDIKHGRLISSAIHRLWYIRDLCNLTSGACSTYRVSRKKHLIINGTDFGLMLEALRQNIHKEIDQNFDREFRTREFLRMVKETAEKMASIFLGISSSAAPLLAGMEMINFIDGLKKPMYKARGNPVQINGLQFDQMFIDEATSIDDHAVDAIKYLRHGARVKAQQDAQDAINDALRP